jgi:hypothetical protein
LLRFARNDNNRIVIARIATKQSRRRMVSVLARGPGSAT